MYDYALMTEPLSGPQLAGIGWRNRQGVADAANQFHYYRLTSDNRILWGGYDAVYYNGGRITAAQDQRPETFARLAAHFFDDVPAAGRRGPVQHAWGGVIDTCSRFCAFFGTAYGGRLGYAAGYTGLGVGASRFGANVMLDLLGGEPTERTAWDGAHQAGAVPAGAGPVRGHPADPGLAGQRRPQSGPPGRLAARRWTGWASASTPDRRGTAPGSAVRR